MELIKLNKTQARRRYNAGEEIILVGDNVNTWHILNGWRLGCEISQERSAGADFDSHVSQFEYYLEREIGKRAAYYQVQAK